MLLRRQLLFVLLMVIHMTAGAWSRMAEAKVSSVLGKPCFSISQKEEARNGITILGALIVSDLSVQPAKEVWSFSLPTTPEFPIPAASCIPYGSTPASATGMAPANLIPGHFYSVFLNGSPK